MKNTQNVPELPIEVSKQRMENRSDADLPGERLIQEAPGAVTEGSARRYAKVMDRITGDSKDNRSKEMKRGRRMG